MTVPSTAQAESPTGHTRRPMTADRPLAAEPVVVAPARDSRTLRGLVRYFLRLGGSGFGGPIALVGYMQRDLVEYRGWYSEQEFQQALAVGQTMPGPLAAPAAMWLGYPPPGARGALSGAVPVVLPPFLILPPGA